MSIITHVLATTLGVKLFHLGGRNAVLAYLFGVAVDIDHLIKAPYYLRAVGLRSEKDYYWRSSLQEPVALLWIVPLSLLLGTWVPVFFFLVHVGMDYLVRYEKMPWYPFSTNITRGWLIGVPDRIKELTLAGILLCSNIFLLLKR